MTLISDMKQNSDISEAILRLKIQKEVIEAMRETINQFALKKDIDITQISSLASDNIMNIIKEK